LPSILECDVAEGHAYTAKAGKVEGLCKCPMRVLLPSDESKVIVKHQQRTRPQRGLERFKDELGRRKHVHIEMNESGCLWALLQEKRECVFNPTHS
jgi:hypothetical protein